MMWDGFFVIAEVYLIGFVVMFINSLYIFLDLISWKSTGVSNILDTIPGMKPWLINRVIFWPYFLFCKTNPLVLLSRIVFSRYGDKGHIYYDTRGLKNFLNDFFRGVDRYQSYHVISSSIELDQNVLSEEFETLPFKPKYATIIIANFNKKYLFRLFYTSMRETEVSTSRFALDQCRCLTKGELMIALNKLNPSMTDQLLVQLERKS